MLLILTNSADVTADYVVALLQQSSLPFLRLDTDSIPSRCHIAFDGTTPVLTTSGVAIAPGDVTHVWYRRPEPLSVTGGDSPEARFERNEWSEALEGFFALIEVGRWMNHPAANVAASHKIEQLVRAQRAGLLVPSTIVTQSPWVLRAFWDRHRGNIVTKPLSVGYIERSDPEVHSLIYTTRVLADDLDDLSDLSLCPTLFQKRVEKACDVRITIVDADIHAVELRANEADGTQRCDIRRNNMDDVSYSCVIVPEPVRSSLQALMRGYGLRFGAIDMAVSVEGEWYFLEINPNGQWAWLDLAGATSIATSLLRALA